MKQRFQAVELVMIVCLLLISGIGVFYSAVLFEKTATNVYGDAVVLFGRGIYAYESLFKGPIFVGTDAVMIVLVGLYVSVLLWVKSELLKHTLKIGFLTIFLYYSASLAFGTMINSLFLLYIVVFGLTVYQLIYALINYDYDRVKNHLHAVQLPKGLLVFLIIIALSVSVWLAEIVTVIIVQRPSAIIGMQTTEPTFVLDLALIAPACFIAFFTLKNKQPIGLVVAIMMLMLLAAIGVIVIAQTVTQRLFGVFIEPIEFIVFVLLFTVLSGFAVYYLKRCLAIIIA